jgi:hypothetical protein
LSHFQVNRIDRARANTGQPGRIAGSQVQGKGLKQTTKSGLTDLGIFVVPVFTFIEKLGSDPWFVALAPGFPGFAYISKNRDLTPVFCFSGKMP